jgi:membrane protein YdbS with pleckstrin-like domain
VPVTLDALVMFLGWIGAAAGVLAYAQVSRGRWAASSAPFQLTNLVAAGLMAMVAGVNGVWPSVAANVVWVLIGVQAVVVIVRARRARRRVLAEEVDAPTPEEVGLAA